MTPFLLSAKALTRDFPGVRALDHVDFDLIGGEVHVLFGENGAGKSTLISILSGAIRATEGNILMNGEMINPGSVHEARAHGISAVFQEFSLVPELTVQENIFLGAETCRGVFLDQASMFDESRRLLDQLGFVLDPAARVETLTRAEQQMVEIVKAFRSELSVLILDEPTASLTSHETRQLFELVKKLKARGIGIIYITHRMSEIREIGDRVTVLRDGSKITTVDVEDTTDAGLVEMMTGREVGALFPAFDLPEPGEEILVLDRVTTERGEISQVSMTVRKGEIIGLAGLAGSGKSSAMQAAFGLVPLASGSIFYHGRNITGRGTQEMIRTGMLYLPADRKQEGLMMQASAAENMMLVTTGQTSASGRFFRNTNAEKSLVNTLAQRLNLSPNRPSRSVDHFSGGNQQKIMLARSISQQFDLIMFNDPTVGVDVGARVAIYEFIAELAKAGTTVVIISSDLMELLNMTQRLYVFCRGRIQAELSGSDKTEQSALAHFFERECA